MLITNYEEFLLLESNNDLNKLLDKVKNLPKESKKKVLTLGLISLMTFQPISTIFNVLKKSNADIDTKKMIENIIKEKKRENWKNGSEYYLSNKGREHIKSTEKLRLDAYKIGDSKITIGWGHAEDLENSKFKVGDKISQEQAKKLLKADLKVAADGVRKIFKEWKKNNIDIHISQDMFDCLVSMAFNMGVSGFRQSAAIQSLKKGDYEKTAELIAKTSISAKFPGLEDRRKKESELFLSMF